MTLVMALGYLKLTILKKSTTKVKHSQDKPQTIMEVGILINIRSYSQKRHTPTTPRLNGSDNSKRKKMRSTLRIATTTLVRHRTHHPWRRQRRRQHRPPTQLSLRRRCKKRLYDGFPVQRSCNKLRFARCGRRHEFGLYEGLARGGGFAEGGFGDRVADCRDGAVWLLCDGLCLCVEGWVVRVDVGVAGHFLRGGGHRWQLERDGVL